MSEPMTIHQTFLEIPVAGNLGTSGLSLELLHEGNHIPIIISQTSKEKWTSVYLLTPQQPFQIVATDQRSDAWLAFAMPRGIGKLSFIVMKLLPLGKQLFILGMLWLLVQYFFQKNVGRTKRSASDLHVYY